MYHIEHHVILNSEYVLSQFQSEIEHSAGLIHPINSSSTNFAKLLSSTLQDTNLSFSDIKTKVIKYITCSSHVEELLDGSELELCGFSLSLCDT